MLVRKRIKPASIECFLDYSRWQRWHHTYDTKINTGYIQRPYEPQHSGDSILWFMGVCRSLWDPWEYLQRGGTQWNQDTWVRGIPWLIHLRPRSRCTPSWGETRHRKWIRQISYDARLFPVHMSGFPSSIDVLNSHDLGKTDVLTDRMSPVKILTTLLQLPSLSLT